MKYKDILRTISKKENITEREIEKQMQMALVLAGLKCTPQEFIESVSSKLRNGRYIV